MVAQESSANDPGTPPEPPTEKETRKQTFSTWIIVAVAAAIIAFGFPESKAANAVIWLARFALTLGILVFVHEWGHYQFARWAGMKVNRFALGFPPWIYTRRHKGIDYSIGALPIGGMVDIAGVGSEEEMVHTSNNQEADVTRDKYRRRNFAVPHGQKEFQEAGIGWRFMTLFAGPMMNFIFTIVVAVALYSLVGVESSKATNQIFSIDLGMPAYKADLRTGDKILGVDGVEIKEYEDLIVAIRNHKGAQMQLLVDRDGRKITKIVEPLFEDRPKMLRQSTLEGKTDEQKEAMVEAIKGKVENVAVLGVEFTQTEKTYERLTVWEAAQTGVLGSIRYAGDLYQLLGRAATFQLTPQEKRSISGPVGIGRAINTSSKRGWYSLVETALMLSLNLGLMNLLPIPALDGGRIMFLFYEMIARRPIDARKEGMVNLVGMLMVLSLMAFLTVRDVLPLITQGLSSLS